MKPKGLIKMSILDSSKIMKLRKSIKGMLTETSPFEELSQHAEKVRLTVLALVEEIHAYTEGNEVDGDTVSKLEFEADKQKQQMRRELPRSDLLMPVARSDLLSLLWHQDEIADNSQDVAELLPLLAMKSGLPKEYKNALDELAGFLEKSVEEYKDLVTEAGKIIQGTSSGPDKLKEIWEIIEQINKFEHEADKTTRKGIKAVYGNETLEDIEKYHLIQIALKTNNTLDHIENAGNFIRIMTNK